MAYDTTKFAFSFGTVAARGYADGEVINWTFDNDEWTAYSGTQGEGTMVRSPQGIGTVTVTLQANSPTNTAWNTLYEAGIPLPLTVNDRSSTKAVAFAAEGMPKKKPDLIRSRDMPVVQWVFGFVNGTAQHLGDV